VWFNSADGTRLHGWFFESQSKPATATIVFFHGNGGHIGNVGIEFGKFCRDHRFAVVAALVAFPGEESI
jgi:alpha-beta hydrolase superfamily lysophospholipase